MADMEILEVGAERRRRVSRRALVVLVVVGVVLATTAWSVDRQRREQEVRSVAGCATGAATAVGAAGSQVRGAYEYVRPSLPAAGPDLSLERGIYRLLAEAAQGAGGPLASPLAECQALSVWPWHAALRERRERCVAVLLAHRRALAAVADDGRTVGAYLDLPRSC